MPPYSSVSPWFCPPQAPHVRVYISLPPNVVTLDIATASSSLARLAWTPPAPNLGPLHPPHRGWDKFHHPMPPRTAAYPRSSHPTSVAPKYRGTSSTTIRACSLLLPSHSAPRLYNGPNDRAQALPADRHLCQPLEEVEEPSSWCSPSPVPRISSVHNHHVASPRRPREGKRRKSMLTRILGGGVWTRITLSLTNCDRLPPLPIAGVRLRGALGRHSRL